MGAPRTTPVVLAALSKCPNQDVAVNDLAAETGLNVQQVQSAVSRLIGRDNLPIKTVLKAQVWRYEPQAAGVVTEAKDQLFEVVGEAAKGDVIVRGDITGKLFRIVPF